MNAPLWTPTADAVAATNLTDFESWLRREGRADVVGYDQLWRWSVDDLNGFWGAVWDYFAIQTETARQEALADDRMPGATWFPGTTVNFAAEVLARMPTDIPVIAVTESGEVRRFTGPQLRKQTLSLATTLQRLGVGRGDRIAGYLPNIGEAAIAFLASASLGAVWCCLGQDYAAPAVVNRFRSLAPKVLVAADGYRFAGRTHSRIEAVSAIRRELELEHLIMIGNLDPDVRLVDCLGWDDATAQEPAVEPISVPFDHPLWVLASSGTTGTPKGLVHSHGGMLLEQLKQLSLHWDLRCGDRLLWYTTPSWVMWNIGISALLTGAGLICYDGSPTHPGPEVLWRAVADQQATVFGASPGFWQASQLAGLKPSDDYDLTPLRALGATGAPVPPSVQRWAAEAVGAGIPMFSMSGGTDVAGAFAGGVPTAPVWAGEISAPCLGVALAAWDEHGRALVDEVGELVITRPMPSMPVRFWDDPGGERYRAAYFDVYPGVWRHGDWVTVTARNSVIVHGRSDATLNRNGVRIGSAEIYQAVESMPEVDDALVVGIERPNGGYWMPLFVVPSEGTAFDDALVARIRECIRTAASPRHVPDEVIKAPGLPHTRTGKRLEIPVKRILSGRPLASTVNPDAVDEPERFDFFTALADERASWILGDSTEVEA